eukprot:1033999-Rhodomonas_salina.3
MGGYQTVRCATIGPGRRFRLVVLHGELHCEISGKTPAISFLIVLKWRFAVSDSAHTRGFQATWA